MKKIIVREKPPFYQNRYPPRLFQIAEVPVRPPNVLPGKELPRVKFQAIRLCRIARMGSKVSGLSDISTFTSSPFPILQLISNRICRSRMLSMGGALVVITTTANSRPMRAESSFEKAPRDSGVFLVNTAWFRQKPRTPYPDKYQWDRRFHQKSIRFFFAQNYLRTHTMVRKCHFAYFLAPALFFKIKIYPEFGARHHFSTPVSNRLSFHRCQPSRIYRRRN
jgi:hypothetical protein